MKKTRNQWSKFRGRVALVVLSTTLASCNFGEIWGIDRLKEVQAESSALSEPLAPADLQAQVQSQLQERAETYARLPDAELFDLLLQRGIGECYIGDARNCLNCACDFYLKSNLVPWAAKGWPSSDIASNGDSTGCISRVQWSGYSPNMATSDLVHNGAAQARDALLHPSDPCGLKADDI